ncbi:hypothetical protein E8K88_17555 [Lampropedia aestuarii]|uniref:Uncharacterized protein n=1 Tax=Lampropedia aestuarii TaxID=2562762 RepID=A0A4S5BIR2_9BURK|nr:hypothetical protein [Lampropedia aestuarii]THJ30685.1 hypothetical protein E8K88_17555 [Lampropedia aestuarii]
MSTDLMVLNDLDLISLKFGDVRFHDKKTVLTFGGDFPGDDGALDALRTISSQWGRIFGECDFYDALMVLPRVFFNNGINRRRGFSWFLKNEFGVDGFQVDQENFLVADDGLVFLAKCQFSINNLNDVIYFFLNGGRGIVLRGDTDKVDDFFRDVFNYSGPARDLDLFFVEQSIFFGFEVLIFECYQEVGYYSVVLVI